MKQIKAPFTKRQKMALISLGVATYFITNDIAILSVTIPTIEKFFRSDITTVQWLINGYTLIFGILIVSGGRLADMFGRRRVFFIGCAVFTLFSIICGLTSNITILLISRALMGVGAAMAWPSLLGMIYSILPKERSGIAGGVIMMSCGIAYVTGPLLGGGITDLLSWRVNFFLNPLEAVVTCVLLWKYVSRDEQIKTAEKIDYAGSVSLSLSLFGLLFAFDMAVDIGFRNPITVALFGMFFLFLGIFLIIEYRSGEDALIPVDIIVNYRLFAACLSSMLVSVAFFAPLLFWPLFLTKVHGYSATLSGVGLIPMFTVFSFVSWLSGTLYDIVKPKWVASLGAACTFLSLYVFGHLHDGMKIIEIIPGMVLLGVGIGLFFPTITTFAVTVVDPSRASLAGAILYMFQIIGASLALGLNTTIVAVSDDITSGIANAFIIDGYLALAGLIICLLFVNSRSAQRNP